MLALFLNEPVVHIKRHCVYRSLKEFQKEDDYRTGPLRGVCLFLVLEVKCWRLAWVGSVVAGRGPSFFAVLLGFRV